VRAAIVSRVYADPETRGKLRALAGLGCSIAALVPSVWRSPADDRLRETAFGDDGGARILPIPVRGPGRAGPEGPRWDRRALRRALAEFRPDVVQVEEEPWMRIAAQVARAAPRVRFRLVAFGWQSLPAPLTLAARLRRRHVVRSAAGLVGGNSLALDLLARDRGAVAQAVLPALGVSPPLLAARDEHERLVIGFVGRLVPEKGLDLLFRACARLRRAWEVHVVGSGPAQEELEELVARLGVAAYVTWHGALRRDGLHPLWGRFDCLALPSRTTERWIEARCRTAIEAMAHGVPVVAAKTGALPEVVGETGCIVPEDDADALAAALDRLRSEPGLRRRLGLAARQRVLAEYTDEAVAQRTLAFWRQVLSAAP